MKKRIVISVLSFLLLGAGLWFSGFVTSPAEKSISADAQIQWMTIEQAALAAQKDHKKILVDVYTDWCGWCKKLDKDTYTDPKVIEYIRKNYHAVKLNAEQKEDITVGGVTYKYVASGRRGYHELAANMLNGRMSYPSTVFFDHQLNIITNVPGYHDAKEMLAIVSFLGEDAYKTTSWEVYQRDFHNQR
ncbi:MAG: thioredoxin family protein [Bacteroidia bacterium]